MNLLLCSSFYEHGISTLISGKICTLTDRQENRKCLGEIRRRKGDNLYVVAINTVATYLKNLFTVRRVISNQTTSKWICFERTGHESSGTFESMISKCS